MARVVNLYKEPFDVYIGRPGKGRSGYFGNPVIAGKPCEECGGRHDTPGSTLPCYKSYLSSRVARDRRFRLKLLTLHSSVLGCFCKPKPCHGDILCEFIHVMIDIEWSEFVNQAMRVNGVNTSSDSATSGVTSVRWQGRAIVFDKIERRAYLVVETDDRRWIAPWTNSMYRALFAMGSEYANEGCVK